jgi:hypothetical protein
MKSHPAAFLPAILSFATRSYIRQASTHAANLLAVIGAGGDATPGPR